MKQVHWYPGHINKTIKELELVVKKLDILVILLDSRAPFSSFLPYFEKLSKNKKVLIVFTKNDLADIKKLKEAQNKFSERFATIQVNLKSDSKAKAIRQIFLKLDAFETKSLLPKIMILGIPNVGKSTIINFLSNQKKARSEDKAGVTKNTTWFKVGKYYILDTPGVLESNQDDKNINYRMAIIGSMKKTILPIEQVGRYLLRYLIYTNKISNFTIENFELELKQYLTDNLISEFDFYNRLIRDFQHLKYGRSYLDDYFYDFDVENNPQDQSQIEDNFSIE